MSNPFRALAWRFIKLWVRRKFPQVEMLSTEQLADWLASERPSPVLIDVRRDDEYAVSHLPNAQHLSTAEAIQQFSVPEDADLVLYCSVGYRSARLAQQLQALGYDSVMNLEGSIFEWFNQGRPVVAQQTRVDQVHPYNSTWGLLLKSSQWGAHSGRSSGRSMSGSGLRR